MPGAWYSAGKGFWTPATTGLTPSRDEFFLDLSAATSSCTRRELSSCPLKQAFSCTPRVPIRLLKNADSSSILRNSNGSGFSRASVVFASVKDLCTSPLVPYMLWNWATYRFKVGHHDSCTVSICYISGKQVHKSL